MQEFGNVGPKTWGDRPVFIVGGGPSLKPFRLRLSLLYQRGIVLAVNDSYKYTNFPDAIVSLDHMWLEKNLKNFEDMPGPVFCAVDDGNSRLENKYVTYLYRKYRTERCPLSDDPTKITNGMTSGFAALNFAYLKGAKTIYLLGFDFKDIDDQTHFHAGYEWHNKTNSNRLYPRWAAAFDDTVAQLNAAGVKVYNCSPDSLLTAFEHKPYSEVLR